MQHARTGRLHPAVGAGRQAVARALTNLLGQAALAPTGRTRVGFEPASGTVPSSGKDNSYGPAPRPEAAQSRPLVLVGCSGGPDSLALAALTAHFVRREDVRAGAVIVDHGLQPESARVAERTAKTLRSLGLDPVLTERVSVPAGTGMGPEMAARTARYDAFTRAVAATGARAVLLGHTLDDQAETVLLGLARGSGTRSLAGMPMLRTQGEVTYLRPLLGMRRADTEDICAAEALVPWRDPTNTDQALTRARVRHSVLPYLEDKLGPGVAVSLARTASIAGADSDYLDATAATEFERLSLPVPVSLPDIPASSRPPVVLDRAAVAGLHPAVRSRVLAAAVRAAGAPAPGFERLAALDEFAAGYATAGPVQLPGHVSAYRRRGLKHPLTGKPVDMLVLASTR